LADGGGTVRTGGRAGRPLQFYFAALAFLIVVVAAGAGAFLYAESAADAQRSAIADASFAAGKAAAQLDTSVKFVQSSMAPLATAPSTATILSNPAAACSLGFAPVGPFDSGHIDLIRADGSVACTSSKVKPAGAVYTGQAWLASSSPTLVGPLTDPADAVLVAVAVYPIAGGGVMAWFLDLAPLGPKLGQEFSSGVNHLEFLITTADGHSVIARSINPTRWVGKDIANTAFASAKDATDRNDLDGTARWYGQSSGPFAWKVYVGADKATALANGAPLLQRQFAIIGVGLLAVLLALLMAYRQVVRPITALSTAVRASRGTTSRPPVPVSGPAEVATLGEDINSLMASLKRELSDRERAESNYKLLFDNHPEPLWVYEISSLRFLEVNGAAIRKYGYSRDEFLQMTIESIRPASELPAFRETLTSLEPAQRSGPWVHQTKDGALMDVEITSHVVDFAGRPARFVMAQDVTEKTKLERQHQQGQRLESLGQLAGGVAHDFNNLLSVILNVTDNLKSELDLAEGDSRRDLDRIEKAAQSASRLTRQLLAFARREVVQGTVLNMSAQVASLTELLRRTLGSHVKLTATLPEDVWPVKMDPGHLEQIVINLAVNSRDAMPRGGNLSLSVGNVTVDEAYAQGRPELMPGRYVQLQVSDSGSGMDKATLDHVFEPFFTTKPVGHGTGLGLATVYGIVKQLGGHIGVYSEVGHGTTVTVLIPATDAAVEVKVATPISHHDRATGTVLLVEDYDDLRELIQEILKAAGYQVLSAPDGAAGLTLSREHSGEIDVLLTDVVMPNMLGPDLADQMKADNPALRVLFMSGHAQPALGMTTLTPDIQLLQKPFMEDELLDKLHEVMAAPVSGGAVEIS
jgi:two-component system cell cycle sensor histidine kinase/response regulator CckA